MKYLLAVLMLLSQSCGRDNSPDKLQVVYSKITYLENPSSQSCTSIQGQTVTEDSYIQDLGYIRNIQLNIDSECRYSIQYRAYQSIQSNRYVECVKTGDVLVGYKQSDIDVLFVTETSECAVGDLSQQVNSQYLQLVSDLSNFNYSCTDYQLGKVCKQGNLPIIAADRGVVLTQVAPTNNPQYSYRIKLTLENQGVETYSKYEIRFKVSDQVTSLQCWAEGESSPVLTRVGNDVTISTTTSDYWANLPFPQGSVRTFMCQVGSINFTPFTNLNLTILD